MKFFIDTANIDEIKEAHSMGMVDGVTTNPSLIAKEGRDFETIIKEICQIIDGPISAEVISIDNEGMVKEARELAAIHENIVAKHNNNYVRIIFFNIRVYFHIYKFNRCTWFTFINYMKNTYLAFFIENFFKLRRI